MNKKILILLLFLLLICSSHCQISMSKSTPGKIYEADLLLNYRNVTVYAPAVAQTEAGDIGVISTITVTIQSYGSGRVFVDTLPLAQIDMQGSARLAVKVASALVENDKNSDINPSEYDYFFVVRTTAPIIGGPSAGGVMTVATVSLLKNWNMSNNTVMTGMINPDGSIGPIGGIREKIDAAYSVGASRFLLPKGQSSSSIEDYAIDNYQIEVVEVADINEALENFTGWRFEFEESNGKITTQDYITSMKPLANKLLDEAEELYEEANSLFQRVKSKIPNYEDYFNEYYYRDAIRSELHNAEDSVEESKEGYNQSLYYTSLTMSFISMIDSQYVIYTCNYFDTDEEDRHEYMINLIDEINTYFYKKRDIALNAEIEGFTSLQGVGAAQKRASEAASFLDDANSSYYLNVPLTALDFLAAAKQRSKSVEWWVNISTSFNETGKINETEIDALALEYIGEAEQAFTYSKILLGIDTDIKMAGTIYLQSAEILLDEAKENREKDYPAAALFEALEALVRSNLEIEILGLENEADYLDRAERANISAASAIVKSRNLGIEPVLAVSYYEYGKNLFNKSQYNSALFYFKYSGMIAGALSITNASEDTTESRYIGIAEVTLPSRFQENDFEDVIIILLAISAGLAGLGLGFIISGFSKDKSKEKEYKKWTPRSLNDYPGKKDEYYQDDMPRSIKDFYKKNK